MHSAFVLIMDSTSHELGCGARIHNTVRDGERNFTGALSPKHTGGAAIRGHGAHRDVGGEFDVWVADTQTGSGGINITFQHLSVDRNRAGDDTILDGGRQEGVLGHEMSFVDGRVLGSMGDGRVARARPASGKRISNNNELGGEERTG